VNKTELIESIADRVGGRAAAQTVLEAIVETIQNVVVAGERVTLSGFGVFERADRAPRVGRNPANGSAVQIAARSVPAFRPGTEFKELVAASARPGRRGSKAGAKVTGAKVTGAKVTAAKVTGAKVTGAKVTGAKVTPKVAAKAPAGKATATRGTTAKAALAKSAALKTAPTKSAKAATSTTAPARSGPAAKATRGR